MVLYANDSYGKILPNRPIIGWFARELAYWVYSSVRMFLWDARYVRHGRYARHVRHFLRDASSSILRDPNIHTREK